MFNDTLTDLYIKRGIIKDEPVPYMLDGDGSDWFVLDGDKPTKNEEKSQE